MMSKKVHPGRAAGLISRAGCAVSILAISAFAVSSLQADPIYWQSGTVQVNARTAQDLAGSFAALAQRGSDRHVVVQFNQPIDEDLKADLAAKGLKLLSYLGSNSFFAFLDSDRIDAPAISATGVVNDVLAIKPVWKMHSYLAQGNVPLWAVVSGMKGLTEEELADPGKRLAVAASQENPVVGAYVLFHKDVSLHGVADSVVRQHGARVRSYLESINGLVIELPYSEIESLVEEDAVSFIEPPLPGFKVLNDSNRARVGAETLWSPPYGLDGSGVSVLVYDGGTALASHLDFQGRAHVRDSSGTHYHSTHVAGTIGGAGVANPAYKGMAPGVTIESYGFEQEGGLHQGFLYTDPGDLEADYTEAITVYGADISNNSIGTNTAWNGFPCEWEGNYGVTANLIDSIVRGDVTGEPFRIVWANGNERGGACGSLYHTTAPPACGKNHITVGALNSNDDSMTDFSSWGPTDDGRIKPDVSAPGCQSNGDGGVTSCSDSSNSAYTTLCGTSMASPTVCGVGALLLQEFRNQYPGEPDFRNSTLKAILAQTGQDNGNTGPDYQFGYGSVRAQPAADVIRDGNFLESELSQGETVMFMVIVNPGDTELKVTLAWDDVPGEPDVLPNLVNDLDLKVFDPSGVQHYPWTLDPANPSAPAVRNQEDHVNNIEQVVIDAPTPGAYRVEIYGYNVPMGPQSFSAVATPALVACSPTGVASLDRVKYQCAATAGLQVVDCDLNTDDNVVDTVDVVVRSSTEFTGETVTLVETDPASSAFAGSIDLSTTDAPGVLHVSEGDFVTLQYIDADDGQGGSNVLVTATATVDCTAPVISNVQVTDIGPREATITFTTNEPARSTVHYGDACGPFMPGEAGEAVYSTDHSIHLTGLQDNHTYFFNVDTEDQAGNMVTDDNNGNCYTFDTPDIPDYFTEEWSAGFDLDGKMLTFVPDGSVDRYHGCVEDISSLPTDPTGGVNLSLSDDDFRSVSVGGGNSVYLYGQAFTTYYVGSNGYITFGGGDTTYSESLSEHFSMRRIAPFFDDLNPSNGGTISYKTLSDRVAVTWQNVPEYSAEGSNTFQVEMFYDGTIRISWNGMTASDCVAGLSEGAGMPADFVASDLSALGPCVPDIPGDLNGDGCVDQTDLGILLSAYGNSADGDIDGDGDTDQSDLGILMSHYLDGC